MTQPALSQTFSEQMVSLPSDAEQHIPALVDLILRESRTHRASDVHLVPVEDGIRMQWRVDGVLHTVARFDAEFAPRLVARLKVMSGLLTYRTDIPQEGRIAGGRMTGSRIGDGAAEPDRSQGEVRVTTFPTLFGEKAAIRLFAGAAKFQRISSLGLPADAEGALQNLLQQTSGVVLLTGPSGSGKTTTVYACLRELAAVYEDTRGLMTLEDPIEMVVPGVTQSQVRPSVDFDLASGLRSMMRQDPDVIMVGEIRDPETAECVFQAALTGHLVLTTFHAGSSAEAIARLLEMGIEPYLIRSTLRTVMCQRLLRKACPECSVRTNPSAISENVEESAELSDNSLPVEVRASGCPTCNGLGYRDRFVTAEFLDPNQPQIAKAIMNHADAHTLQCVANDTGTVTLRARAEAAVADGVTHSDEVFRVLGRTQPVGQAPA